MYSKVFPKYKERVYNLLDNDTTEDFNFIISKLELNEVLTLEESISLLKLSAANKDIGNKVIETVRKKRFNKYNNQVNLIVPHYQSSKCEDNCVYCGFRRANNKMERTSLSEEDFEKEINLLIDWGYTSYEFCYATDSEYTPKKIGMRIKKAKEIARRRKKELFIGVDAQSFETNDYKILKEHEMDFLVLWMETYTDMYAKVHPKDTKKGNFEKRLNASDSLIQAGITRYSLGVLLGLSPWIEDVALLIAHGIYLRDTYGYSPYITGIPKLTDAIGLNNSPNSWKNIPTDEELILISYIYKAIFPDTKLFVNQRQEFDINLEIVKGGGDLYTVDFTTFPGAYLNKGLLDENVTQFKTLDYSRKEIIERLEGLSIKPKFNWPFENCFTGTQSEVCCDYII